MHGSAWYLPTGLVVTSRASSSSGVFISQSLLAECQRQAHPAARESVISGRMGGRGRGKAAGGAAADAAPKSPKIPEKAPETPKAAETPNAANPTQPSGGAGTSQAASSNDGGVGASGSSLQGQQIALANAEPAVPIVRPPPAAHDAGAASPKRARHVMKPVLPDATKCGPLGTKEVMKKVVPWVHSTLPMALRGKLKMEVHDDLSKHVPLRISDKDEISSYKQPWVPENCFTSVQKSGLYEAGGSLFWIDPELGEYHLPAEDPSWAWVHDAAVDLFKPYDHNGHLRIRFPIALPTCLRRGVRVAKNEYPHGGALVPLSGHAFIYAWYVAAFKALDANDLPRVVQLFECALTVTATMWVDVAEDVLVIESIKGSEIARQASKVLVDSFVTFAEKVWKASPKIDVKYLQSQDVKFNGGLMNTTMAKTVENLKRAYTQGAKDLCANLDRQFGSEILTASYNKVRLMLNAVKSDPENFEWVLDAMTTALRRQEVTPDDFKYDAYQKKSGEANFIQHAMTVRTVVQHFDAIATSIRAVDDRLGERLKTEVVDKLKWPSDYDRAFPIQETEEAKEAAAGGEASGSLGDEVNFLDKLVESNCPKGLVQFAELFKKVHEGAYSDVIAALALEPNVAEILQSLDSDVLGSLRDDLKETLKTLHAAESVVSCNNSGLAPQPTLRSLVKRHSDGGDEEASKAERQDVWRRAVTQRKKFVQLGVVKNPRSAASYAECLKKFPQFASFKGVPGQKHRVFSLSADLMSERGKQPWLEASAPEEKLLEETCNFLTSCRGPVDVVLGWDGCSRGTVRRHLEDTIGAMNCSAEVAVIYKSSWNSWVKKKYLFASENKETGYVAMPVSRGKMGVQKSVGESGSSEDSSHWTTLSGVALPNRASLARIVPEDKLRIFSERPDALPKKWSDLLLGGVPLHWMESKGVYVWGQMLKYVKADVVVDLSPGSGVLATTCMKLGIPYLGMVSNQVHQTWLTNVIDRAALKYIVMSGHVLYQDDLATLVKDLFAEILEEGADADQDGEEDLKSSDEEGGEI